MFSCVSDKNDKSFVSFSLEILQVLGTGMSTKMWEVTVEHARTCLVDKKVYLYYTSVSVPKTGVVFNIVGQVMGLFPDCQYVSADKLSETQKACIHNK